MNIKYAVEIFISSICASAFLLYSGKGFLNGKMKKNIKSLFIILGLLAFVFVNYLFLDNATKLVISYLAALSSFVLLYKKGLTQCAIAALISYLLVTLGEALFIVFLIILEALGLITNIIDFTGSIFANIFICLVATLIFYIVKKPIRKLLSKVKDNNKFTLMFTFVMVIIAIGSLFYKMYFNNWQLNNSLLLNMSIIICLVYIAIIIIKQHIDKSRINDEYEGFVRYSKESEKLVEQYSISLHENQNELIVIKSMVNKKNTKLLEYLDGIIESKDNIKNAWIRYLRFIPFGGLKGILHNKISCMMEQGINVLLNISKDIKNSKLNQLTMKENDQLCKIIGVFLDNARESAIESKNKESAILVYMEGDNVIFEISNSYDGKVNVDNIYDSGYSSKGKSRGYGLSLVKSIIDENNIFENVTEIKNGYFIQRLKAKK